MIGEYFRAARYLLTGRICTRLFKGTYDVAIRGERGWQPKGDPILYYVTSKRLVWNEARPIDADNYRLVQCEVSYGKLTSMVGFFGKSETDPLFSHDGRQIFSRQEALVILAQREDVLQKMGWNGNLQVKRNRLFGLKHYRHYMPENQASQHPAPV